MIQGLKSLVKTSMSFACTFNERDLMSICIPQSICATGRTTHSYKYNLVVMTDESLSVSA
ncbi:hypothetical protein C4J92_1887 [Pseudomonas sp. R3-18-08]|nr:hypothetical protein C4J92_1887 [Pseudomonas sp. R3-18-08]